MKKLFSFIILCLLTLAASGRVVVFDAAVDLGNPFNTPAPFTVEKDGVELAFSYGLSNGTQYRFYKNSTLTVTCKTGVIISIEFLCTASGSNQYGPGAMEPVEPEVSYSVDGNTGLWEGNLPQISFIASHNQVRFTKIIVTVVDSGIIAPQITPAGGSFYDPVEVSISCITTGATIHFTTDGSEPTTQSTVYTEPFVLSENTTVKALAELDGEVSDVTSAKFVFKQTQPVSSIMESQTLLDGETVRFINPMHVLAQNKRYLWVKDETGCALFYGDCGQTYTNGDEIPAGFIGTMNTYSCERELFELFGFKPASSNTPIDPEPITPDQVGHETFGHFVTLEGIHFTTEDGTTYKMTDAAGNECSVYFGSMGVSAPDNLDYEYTVTGIVGSYGRENSDCIYQVLPTKLDTSLPEFTLCDLGDFPDNETFYSIVESRVVVQANSYLYIKQGEYCYGLVYGNVGQIYNHGDIIPPGWSGTKKTYAGEPEIANPTGFQPAIGNEPLVPEVVEIPEIDHTIWAHYVALLDVTISEKSGNTFKITDSKGNSCTGYGRFVDDIAEGHYDALMGIVGSYRTNGTFYYELVVIDFNPKPLPPEVESLEDLLAKPEGQTVRFTKPLVVVYQNGNYTYVRDIHGCSSMMYGTPSDTWVNGDSIIGYAKWARYGEVIELIPVGTWEKTGHGPQEKPVYTWIEEVSQYMSHHYLGFADVIFTTDELGRKVIEDETAQLLIFDRWPIDTIDYYDFQSYDLNGDGEVNIADINMVIEVILTGKTYPTGNDTGTQYYDVEGFLSLYQGELWLYPTLIARKHSLCIIGDPNGDGEVNIADVNFLVNIILKGR